MMKKESSSVSGASRSQFLRQGICWLNFAVLHLLSAPVLSSVNYIRKYSPRIGDFILNDSGFQISKLTTQSFTNSNDGSSGQFRWFGAIGTDCKVVAFYLNNDGGSISVYSQSSPDYHISGETTCTPNNVFSSADSSGVPFLLWGTSDSHGVMGVMNIPDHAIYTNNGPVEITKKFSQNLDQGSGNGLFVFAGETTVYVYSYSVPNVNTGMYIANNASITPGGGSGVMDALACGNLIFCVVSYTDNGNPMMFTFNPSSPGIPNELSVPFAVRSLVSDYVGAMVFGLLTDYSFYKYTYTTSLDTVALSGNLPGAINTFAYEPYSRLFVMVYDIGGGQYRLDTYNFDGGSSLAFLASLSNSFPLTVVPAIGFANNSDIIIVAFNYSGTSYLDVFQACDNGHCQGCNYGPLQCTSCTNTSVSPDQIFYCPFSCPDNCTACTGAICTTCISGYDLVGNSCLLLCNSTICSSCLTNVTIPNACAACTVSNALPDDNYYCPQSCSSHCASCRGNNCTTCEGGYDLLTDAANNVTYCSMACNGTVCSSCMNDINNCTACANPNITPDFGFCPIACPDNCTTCTGSTCTACVGNFFMITGMGAPYCSPCNASCAGCYGPYDNCSTCANSSIIPDTNGFCPLLCPEGCSNCTGSNCTVCSSQYFLTPSGNDTNCTVCNLTACSNCTGSADNCLACANTSIVPDAAGFCPANCPYGCATCNGSNCTSCIANYFLGPGGVDYNCSQCNTTACNGCFGTTNNCTACANSTYVTKDVNGFCPAACPVGCTACTGSSCTACALNYFLAAGGVCLGCNTTSCNGCFGSTNNCTVCLNSSYVTKDGNGFCPAACPTSCTTCTGLSCTACVANYFLTAGGAGQICSPCNITACNGCTGNANNCAVCANSTYVTKNGTGFCPQACPTGCTTCTGSSCTACALNYFLTAGGTGQICSPCNATACNGCTVNANYCTACYNATITPDSAHFCPAACPVGCTVCTGSSCTACDANYFLTAGGAGQICSPCNTTACNGCAGNANNCSTCTNPWMARPATGFCPQYCPADCSYCIGSNCSQCNAGFALTSNGTDVLCVASGCNATACSACSNNPNNCTVCINSTSVTPDSNGFCPAMCPANCTSCTGSSCTTCLAGYFVTVSGYTSAVCQQCNTSACSACFGNQNNCSACTNASITPDALGFCPAACPSNCLTCTGSSCTSCSHGAFLSAISPNVSSCPSCNASACNGCLGNANNCSTCANSSVLKDANNYCPAACSANCLNCNSSGCNICQSGYLLKAGLCLPPVIPIAINMTNSTAALGKYDAVYQLTLTQATLTYLVSNETNSSSFWSSVLQSLVCNVQLIPQSPGASIETVCSLQMDPMGSAALMYLRFGETPTEASYFVVANFNGTNTFQLGSIEIYQINSSQFSVSWSNPINTAAVASSASMGSSAGALMGGGTSSPAASSIVGTAMVVMAADPSGTLTKFSQVIKVLSRLLYVNIPYGPQVKAFLESSDKSAQTLQEPSKGVLYVHTKEYHGKLSDYKLFVSGPSNLGLMFKMIAYIFAWLIQSVTKLLIKQRPKIGKKGLIVLYMIPKIHIILFNIVFIEFSFYMTNAAFHSASPIVRICATISMLLILLDLTVMLSSVWHESLWVELYKETKRKIEETDEILKIAAEVKLSMKNKTHEINDSVFERAAKLGILIRQQKGEPKLTQPDLEIDYEATYQRIHLNTHLTGLMFASFRLEKEIFSSRVCRMQYVVHALRTSTYMWILIVAQFVPSIGVLTLMLVEVLTLSTVITSYSKFKHYRNKFLFALDMSQSIFLMFFLAMVSRLPYMKPGQVPSNEEELACIYSVYISCISEYALTLIVISMNIWDFVKVFLASQKAKKYIRRTNFLLHFIKMRLVQIVIKENIPEPQQSEMRPKSRIRGMSILRQRIIKPTEAEKGAEPKIKIPSLFPNLNMSRLSKDTVSSNIEKSKLKRGSVLPSLYGSQKDVQAKSPMRGSSPENIDDSVSSALLKKGSISPVSNQKVRPSFSKLNKALQSRRSKAVQSFLLPKPKTSTSEPNDAQLYKKEA